jgi:hypothetical protein
MEDDERDDESREDKYTNVCDRPSTAVFILLIMAFIVWQFSQAGW